ncbi:MAG: Wzz/FepE/Etk N-terminal domain-containing protein [Muribaculum sp.]|nr:Wzz/FepE/Etk N-terminal domain-containing protein [Muribaculum sp.]
MDNTQAPSDVSPVRRNGKFLHICLQHWPRILICTIIFAVLGSIYAYIKQPQYDIEANVLITDDDKDANLMKSFNMSDILLGNSTSADQEMAIMTSHSQFRGIAMELHTNINYVIRKNILKRIQVYNSTPIELMAPPEIADTLRNILKFKVGVDEKGYAWVKAKDIHGDVFVDLENQKLPLTLNTIFGEFQLMPTQFFKIGKPLRMNISFIGYDHAAENLQKEIKCFIPSRKADIVSIAYKCDNIDYGKSVVNLLVDEYNQQVINRNRQKAQRIADFLDQRIAMLAQELKDSELGIQDYKKANDLTAIEVDAEYYMTKKAEVEARLIEGETNLQILETVQKQLSDPQNQYSMLPLPSDAEAVAKLIGEYNQLILERMKLESAAKPNSTVMRTLNEQIEAMRKTVLATINRQIASAKIVVRDARAEVNKSTNRLSKVPTQEREYIELKRDQQIVETMYLFMLKEREQASITIANALPKGVIVDRAYALIKPASASKFTIIAFFILMGLCAYPAWLYASPIIKKLITRFIL